MLVPVQITLVSTRPSGAPEVAVADQESARGSYLPPVFIPQYGDEEVSSPPQTTMTVPVQTAE